MSLDYSYELLFLQRPGATGWSSLTRHVDSATAAMDVPAMASDLDHVLVLDTTKITWVLVTRNLWLRCLDLHICGCWETGSWDVLHLAYGINVMVDRCLS